MLDIKKSGEWIIVNDKIVFCDDFCAEDHTKYIILRKTINNDFLDNSSKEVNFPWEYDIKWIWIIVAEAKDNTLSYIINIWNEKFSIIQHKSMLAHDDIEDSKYLLFFDDSIEHEINQMELEWERINVTRFTTIKE